jgi:hypothetical protein
MTRRVHQGLNCQVGGLTSAYSLSLHTGDSSSLTTAGGLKLTPQGIPEHLVGGGGGGGVSKQLGGSTLPGNSNTALHYRPSVDLCVNGELRTMNCYKSSQKTKVVKLQIPGRIKGYIGTYLPTLPS